MKTKLLFICFIFSAISTVYSQCSVMATDFENNSSIPMYNVMGDVTVVLNTNNTVTLNLGDNFTTAAGPDIRAYFVASNGATDATLRNSLISNLENFEFGLVGSNSVNQNGSKMFTVNIPTNANISNYDRVFFYCQQFDQFWDFGKIIPFTNTTCSALNVVENTLSQQISLSPNPANDILEISNNAQTNINFSVYNTLGDRILEYKNLTKQTQTIDISSLKTGLYLIRFSVNGNTFTKKLIKH
ncbi:T9SS type A sorting domain-containing protein [uncultured Winogradskyella sp.]|uniref:T9SS type A sorting domain-containing protein n=1 Tax=uncultured Winogradskyella sp. TaxID=395353 RepID=UPI00260492A8|nr:T9SS type A sorting domain-containing protein [uncultured Winogradskyella sp.]